MTHSKRNSGKTISKAAQSTIEFTILVTFMVFMFSVFFALIGQKLVDLRNDRNYEIGKGIKDIVLNELQLAKVVEHGYSREFRLPTTVEGMNYDIHVINDTEIVIDVGGKESAIRVPDNVTGNLSRGMNRISKIDGIIYLSVIESAAISGPNYGNYLQCSVKSACSANEKKIFGFADVSEAEMASQNNFGNSVCCRMASATVNLTNDCNSDYKTVILRLSDVTNAHAELPSASEYPTAYNVCLGTNLTDKGISCVYSTAVCDAGMACLGSISTTEQLFQTTNLHLAGCSLDPDKAYITKICCRTTKV